MDSDAHTSVSPRWRKRFRLRFRAVFVFWIEFGNTRERWLGHAQGKIGLSHKPVILTHAPNRIDWPICSPLAACRRLLGEVLSPGVIMLVVMQSQASEEQVRAVCRRIESLGLKAHPIPGTVRTAIGITGNKGAVDLGVLESLPGVVECIPVSKPYKLVSRDVKEEDTILRIPTPGGEVIVGGRHVALVAGPCAVETEEQCLAIAERLKNTGVKLFRGGAYKPRTSPYSFQGLGEPGLKILAKVREQYGFGIITEAIDKESLELVEEYADVIQIGARNMQNFSLLKRAGRAKKPILLKRGMSATLDEFLMAAE